MNHQLYLQVVCVVGAFIVVVRSPVVSVVVSLVVVVVVVASLVVNTVVVLVSVVVSVVVLVLVVVSEHINDVEPWLFLNRDKCISK